MQPTLLDLFSGIGGFSLAGKWAGFKTVQFVEKDVFCQKILKKHWPHVAIHDDIKTFNFNSSVDLITGGFPCQPFSIAGNKKGTNDERYLWPEFFRVINQVKPAWVIAENVLGIVAMELDNIISDLENANYETRTFIVPACAANAPHRRERVWIIANSINKRCDLRTNFGEKRHLQNNEKRNIKTLQSEWEKFKPKSWSIMSAKDWLDINSELSRNNDGVSDRMDRIKALGNAIVPQIAYVFLKIIYDLLTV